MASHRIIGWLNPHCAVCGRTLMEIQAQPSQVCQRHTLPFEFDDLKPTPAKAELKVTTKERAS